MIPAVYYYFPFLHTDSTNDACIWPLHTHVYSTVSKTCTFFWNPCVRPSPGARLRQPCSSREIQHSRLRQSRLASFHSHCRDAKTLHSSLVSHQLFATVVAAFTHTPPLCLYLPAHQDGRDKRFLIQKLCQAQKVCAVRSPVFRAQPRGSSSSYHTSFSSNYNEGLFLAHPTPDSATHV